MAGFEVATTGRFWVATGALKQRLKALAPGLTPRAVLEKLKGLMMIDVYLPTTDGRHIVLSRYTQPEDDQKLLLARMKLKLPEQPPPKIYAPSLQEDKNPVVPTLDPPL